MRNKWLLQTVPVLVIETKRKERICSFCALLKSVFKQLTLPYSEPIVLVEIQM